MKTIQPRKLATQLPVFRFGAITIPVHFAEKVKGDVVYPGFRFKITLGGEIFEGHRSDLEELRELARGIVDAYNSGQFGTKKGILVLSGDGLDRYSRLMEFEKKLGSSLINFLQDEAFPAKEYLKNLPGVTLALAALNYATRHSNCRPIAVRGAVARFLAAKTAKGISKNQFRRYRQILGHLADKYGHKPMSELTTIRVRAFLRGLTRQIRNKQRKRII